MLLPLIKIGSCIITYFSEIFRDKVYIAWCNMSHRTKNSLASLCQADVQRFVLEISDTAETKDTAKEEDPKVERVEPKNVNDKHENETYGDETMPKLIAHVADVAAEEQTKIKHSTCDECKSNKQEIMEIKAMLTEIKTNQMKDRENTITNGAESIAKINSLHEENNEMASEIAFLKATTSELVRDNESIRKIFDLKQNKWVKVESKPSSSKTIPPDLIPTTSTGNRFETLVDENNENLSNAETHVNVNAQNQDYRLKQQSNFKCRKKNKQTEIRNHPNAGHVNNIPARKQTTDVKKVLVIGDLMVKHIDRQKIERAAGCQSVVHSYSGAKVEQINAKIKEYWSESDKFDAVFLHVCTNNLVSEEPEEVAAKMDGLIKDLKGNARKIAVSSVVKRYDNRVSASKITRFNDLANNLCTKHNTIHF